MRRRFISPLAASCATLLAVALRTECQQPIYITFEGPPIQPPGSAALVQRYDEAGMIFTPIDLTGFVRVGSNPTSFRPDNGTSFLQAGLGSTLRFQFLRLTT